MVSFKRASSTVLLKTRNSRTALVLCATSLILQISGPVWACSMMPTPSVSQTPTQTAPVMPSKDADSTAPLPMVQADVLPQTNGYPQSSSGCDTDGQLQADALVNFDPETSPGVLRAKETFDKAARKYADAKRKLDKWLNRLTKDQKDKLKKAEEEAKTTYKDSFEAIKAEDRARTGYFMADDTLKEAEDKLKDPNIAEKDKPTEEEMESLRADAKARKESLSNAKKESQRLGEKAKSADDKLKEILAKDFPGKENEYGADKGNLDEAKEQMDKAESGLKDAREKAMKG